MKKISQKWKMDKTRKKKYLKKLMKRITRIYAPISKHGPSMN